MLGAQATGGDGVDKRIDVIATAIRAGLTVDDLADLELAYSPPFGSAKDPVNIPHTELRHRLGEIPRDRPLLVYCASGFRSYLALRLPRQSGWPDVRSPSGGLTTPQLELPRLTLDQDKPAAELTSTGR